MIRKVLIANRGEIALRIIRACRELGIKTVAVYSDSDENSLHVQLADEAVRIGASAGQESYLRVDRILSAAQITNVDAIHPGYGFLSENALFAEQCERCNIKFIGPKSNTIRQMGDKAIARDTVQKFKVPTVPGSDGTVENESEGLKCAKEIGFPVIIKAVAGGGGRGMRVAHNAVSFGKEFETAKAEAEKSFGNGEIYIEKFIEAPRHIEFQILADEHGKVIHLGERDCSVQRRHQKIIEEAPSPFLTPELRKTMGKAAIKAAQATEYQNAGTVEFIVDRKKNFYFIEMNTRIQVEHGVTEEVTGIDLIKEQLSIANGEKLGFDQRSVKFQRHSIECRICAEDPVNNFRPSPGEIDLYYPPGGHGIRVDSHVYSGYVISPYYDSMISKLISFGRNRTLALNRMERALGEYIVKGKHIRTNIPFCRAIIKDPIFREGKATTRYVEDMLSRTPKEMFSPLY